MRYGRWSHITFPRIKQYHVTAHQLAAFIKIVAGSGALLVLFLLFKIQASTNSLAHQAKATADRNQVIAKVNGQHIDCIAQLFAQYTRDQKPIAKADLDKCQITEAEAAGIVGPSLFSGAVNFASSTSIMAPATDQKTPSPNSNTNLPASSNQNPTNQTTTPTTSSPEPVRVLGVPACVPDPLGLINGGVCIKH